MQYPHPLHTSGFISTLPSLFFEIASNGHLRHSSQLLHKERSICAICGSSLITLSEMNALVRAAASPDCAIVSVTSFGDCAVPQTKIPSLDVSTGLSFECFSLINPSSLSVTFSILATCFVPDDASIADDSTTISAGISFNSWVRVSSILTTRL